MKHLFAKVYQLFVKNLVFFLLVGVWILVMLLIKFNTRVADSANSAKEAANATRQIVAKQDETLNAIRTLALDNKLLSEQKTNIIICMLQVPISERTTDTVTNCRKQAESSTPPSQSANNQNTTLRSSQNTNSNTSNNNQQQNKTSSGGGGTSQPGTVMQVVHDVGGFFTEVGHTVKGLF